MDPARRRLLALAAAVAVPGCIDDPGRACSGATYRLRLSPAGSVEAPLSLEPSALSTASNAVVEAAIEDEHVENCVDWGGTPGPSEGLQEVGERVEAHAGVSLADRTGDVAVDVVREGEEYRLVLEIEA